MTEAYDRLSVSSPGWRGYLATVLGGLLGLFAAYIAVGLAIGPLAIRSGDCDWSGPECDTVSMIYLASAYAGYVGACLLGGLGAGMFNRPIRSGGALATGVLAIPILYGALSLGTQFRAEPAGHVTLLTTGLLLSRWLGIRWHAWRTRSPMPAAVS